MRELFVFQCESGSWYGRLAVAKFPALLLGVDKSERNHRFVVGQDRRYQIRSHHL